MRPRPPHRQKKPNVVLILIDDFGYECVTATGGESYRLQDAKRRRRSGWLLKNPIATHDT